MSRIRTRTVSILTILAGTFALLTGVAAPAQAAEWCETKDWRTVCLLHDARLNLWAARSVGSGAQVVELIGAGGVIARAQDPTGWAQTGWFHGGRLACDPRPNGFCATYLD